MPITHEQHLAHGVRSGYTPSCELAGCAGPAVRLPTAEDLLALHLEELDLHFERQYQYAPPRKFRADFAVWRTAPIGTFTAAGSNGGTVDGPHRLFLIEVTGGIYSKQAHGSVSGVLKDNERLWHAFVNGWHMVRFTPQQVERGEAKAMIAKWLG
jgi:hypothetical protein